MAEKLQVYKCEACGNIVEVLFGGKGELVCCGQPMKLFVENTVDAAKEKHVPVVEKTADGFKVQAKGCNSQHESGYECDNGRLIGPPLGENPKKEYRGHRWSYCCCDLIDGLKNT